MTPVQLEKLIDRAKTENWSELRIGGKNLDELPESIGYLINLQELIIYASNLICLPESIGYLANLKKLIIVGNNGMLSVLPESIGNLINLQELEFRHTNLTSLPSSIKYLASLTKLTLYSSPLKTLPESIGQLTNLQELDIRLTQLARLPESIGKLTNLRKLYIVCSELTKVPNSICYLLKLKDMCICRSQLDVLPQSFNNLTNLQYLDISFNRLNNLPDSIKDLNSLIEIELDSNPLTDLSILKSLPTIESVSFFNIDLSYRYWTKLSEWQPQWLLDEDNAEIRKILIEQVGYDRICQELDAIVIDNWREYSLLKIEGVDIEPMMLLKMTCPSTAHIHVLRVPPDLKTAEAAITWVNHGIHPDDIAIQT